MFVFKIYAALVFIIFKISAEEATSDEHNKEAEDKVNAQFSDLKKIDKIGIGDKYGDAKLTRLQNQTSFPLKISESISTDRESFFLKNNSVIKFKAMSDQFDKKPYLRCSREVIENTKDITQTVLRADGFSSESPNSLFLVNVFSENEKNYIEISPKEKITQKVGVDSDFENEFFVSILDDSFFQANQLAKRWEVFGSINKCFLKNLKNNGFLGPIEVQDAIGYSTDLIQKKDKLFFGDIVVFSPKINSLKIVNVSDQIILSKKVDDIPINWFIKGEHSPTDRLNCKTGQSVENGSIIRLENTQTGKNLTVSALKNIEFNDKDLEKKQVVEAGSNGIGSEQDNWIIFFVDNKKGLALKNFFYLRHVVTGSFLCKDDKNNLFGLIKKADSSEKEVSGALDAISKNLNNDFDGISKPQESVNDQLSNSKKDKRKEKPVLEKKDLFLEQKQFQLTSFSRSNINKKNLMQTGFDGGAKYERIGTTIPNNQELSIEIINSGDQDFLQPKSDRWLSDFSLKKNSVFLSGMTRSSIPNLLPGMSLLISPLYESGIVWIERSLDNINEAVFCLLVKQSEESKFSIVFGNSISDKYVYKIVFDQNYNYLKKMEIIGENKIEKELAKFSNLENPSGKILPGQVTQIWIFFQEGSLFVGKTNIVGNEMFFAFTDYDFTQKIDRIGFSCANKEIFISSIEAQSSKKIRKPSRQYKKLIKLEKQNPASNINFQGFRQSDQALFLFDGKQLGNEKFYFFNKDADKQYLLNLNFQSNEILIKKIINSKTEIIFKATNITMQNFKNKDKSLWVHYSQGFFWAGLEDFGKNSLFCFKDPSPLQGIEQLSLSTDNLSFSTVDSYSEISFIDKDQKLQHQNNFYAENKAIAVSPFLFELKQEAEQVFLKDNYSKKSYMVAQAQKKDTDYSFLFKIDDSGIPSMRLAWQPENESLLTLKWQAKALATTTEALYLASSHMEGSGSIGQLIGTAASVATASLSVPLAFVLANIKGNLLVAQNDQDLQKKNISQKYTAENNLNSDIPSSAIANRYQLESMLNDLEKFSPSTKDMYLDLLNRYKKVVNLIIHPYVVGTDQIKSTIKSGLKALYNYQKKAESFLSESTDKKIADSEPFILMIRENLVELLINSIQNPYLFLNKTEDILEKKTWFSWSNILVQSVIQNKEDRSFELPKMFGESFWMKDKLKNPGKGKVYFQAKGTQDIWITFSKSPRSMDEQKEIYTILIRHDDEMSGIIKLKSFGSIAASTASEDLKLSDLEYKEYFVEINDGLINVGIVSQAQDIEEEKIILSFLDKYSEKEELFVGFGSWTAPCSITNIKIN